MADDAHAPPRKTRWRSPLSPRRATGRLALSTVLGIVAFAIATPGHLPWWIRAVVGWDVASLTLVTLAWTIILRADAKETRRHAGGDDPGRSTVFVIALLSSLFSLFAAATVLRQVKTFPVAEAATWTVLTLGAVALSWVVTHTAYTLRYAHLHYRRTRGGTEEGAAAHGLQFPGTEEPSDIDFAYFAFTIGMCFQVSDVVVTSTTMRRAVLLHAVLSFVYNTTILALSLNLVTTLLG